MLSVHLLPQSPLSRSGARNWPLGDQWNVVVWCSPVLPVWTSVLLSFRCKPLWGTSGLAWEGSSPPEVSTPLERRPLHRSTIEWWSTTRRWFQGRRPNLHTNSLRGGHCLGHGRRTDILAHECFEYSHHLLCYMYLSMILINVYLCTLFLHVNV